MGDGAAGFWPLHVVGQPITREIALRLQLSLQLAVMATVVAVLLAIPLGTLAALRQDSWVDYMARVFAIAGLATPPSGWALSCFSSCSRCFAGFRLWCLRRCGMAEPVTDDLASARRRLSVLRRGHAYDAFSHARVLREDYIRTARAKGLWQRLIVKRHALKNALLPVLTVIGLEFAFCWAGSWSPSKSLI